MGRIVSEGSRTFRRRNTKRVGGRPLAKQPGKNGSKRTVHKARAR